MVPSDAVMYRLFNLKEEKKDWKQKKIPLKDFEKITGELSASVKLPSPTLIIRIKPNETQIRYGYLRVISKDIILKWDREENSFTVSGLYGL